MRCVAGVCGGEGVATGGQGYHNAGFAFGIERRAGQSDSSVADGDTAARRKAIVAEHVHRYGGLRAPTLIAGLRSQRGLRGQPADL